VPLQLVLWVVYRLNQNPLPWLRNKNTISSVNGHRQHKPKTRTYCFIPNPLIYTKRERAYP